MDKGSTKLQHTIRPRRAPQSGVSLVELVVSMTGGAAVLCLAIGTVQQTMNLSKDCDARATHQTVVARLGQQFRKDVHRLNGFSLETATSNTAILRNQSDDSTITYKVSGSTVTREATMTDSRKVAREIYQLDKRSSARIESTDSRHLSLLIIRRPPDGGEMLENRIVAQAGRLAPLQNLRKGP